MSIDSLSSIAACRRLVAKIEVQVYLRNGKIELVPVKGIHMKLKQRGTVLVEGETNSLGTKLFTIPYYPKDPEEYSVHLFGHNGIYDDDGVSCTNPNFILTPFGTEQAVTNVVFHLDPVTLLKLHLMRGGKPRGGRCKVIVEDNGKRKLFESPPLDIQDGYLEVASPRLYADRASIAKLYYLNGENKKTGEALLLHIGERETSWNPP